MCDELLLRPNLRLRVGEHVIDIGALRLVTRATYPRLTSKAVAVLLELVRHAGDTVTRDQLLQRVWKDRVTTPDVLTQAVKELRRAFADDSRPSRYIETIPKVGYRLLASASIHSVGDAAILATAIVAASAENEVHDAINGHVEADAPATGQSQGRPRWMLPVVGLCTALVVVFFVGWELHGTNDSHPWQANDIRAITSDPEPEYRPHISPDGTRVAYGKLDAASGFDRIYIRAIKPSELINLTSRTDAAHDALPIWSPDGSQIAFERLAGDSCTIFIASSLGGGQHEVGACHDVIANYFDWTPDGQQLITAERMGGAAGDLALLRWNLANGTKEWLNYQRAPRDQDLEPRYSPDGRWIAFRRGIAPYSDLCLIPAGGGEVRQLTHLGVSFRGYTWSSDNTALIFASNYQGRYELYAVDTDNGIVHKLGVAPAQFPDAARVGNTVVYEIQRTRSALAELELGADSKLVRHVLAPSTGSDDSPALSPDGGKIAFISDRGGSQQLWLYDVAADSAFPLTEFENVVLLHPVWRSDGRTLLVTVRLGARASLVEIDQATHRQHVVSEGDNILLGSFGADAESYLLLVGASAGDDHMELVRHAGSAQETRTLLGSGVQYAEVDAAANAVYYTKTADRGLFRRKLDGGDAEQLVTPLVSSIQLDGWRVVNGRIWFIPLTGAKPEEMREFDPVSAQVRVIARFDFSMGDINFSVDASGKRIIAAPVAVEDTDVGAFELTHASAPR